MNWIWYLIFLGATSAMSSAATQSLTEVARKEAERRQKIDQQNVQVKKIESADLTSTNSNGTVSVSKTESSSTNLKVPATKPDARATLRSFQIRLQKLDNDIVQAEERLRLLRARAEAERWTVARAPKGSRGAGLITGQDQFRWQILEAEGKLAGLRRDRSDVFQAGRKAGYLPGDLEMRGIVR